MTRIPRLFELMNQNGLKAKSLASQLPISEGNISDWKSGRSMPSADKLVILADYFHVSVDYLLGRTDTPNGENVNNISGNSNNGDNSINIGTKSEEILSEPTDDTMTRKFFDVFVHLDFAQQVNVMKYALEQAEKSA